MGRVMILNHTGDEVAIEWDPADEESVTEAKAEWARLKEAGYEFFEPAETKGKRITRFNRRLERVLAAPGAQTKADQAKGSSHRGMSGGPNNRRS